MSSRQKNIKPVLKFAELARSRAAIRILLHERPNVVMEGNLTGFDEFMNIIMENTVEINTKSEKSASLGTLMLKSDCIAMLLVKPATIQSQTQMDGN